jgi:hypothetical protein
METRHAANDEQTRSWNGGKAADADGAVFPSIALHLDLTNHGQVPKLCRRTR